jgi:hypothetical protein
MQAKKLVKLVRVVKPREPSDESRPGTITPASYISPIIPIDVK